MDTVEQIIEMCAWGEASFLIFSSNVFDPLIYYSHILPILLSLPLAIIILRNNIKSRINQLFFILVFLFTSWTLIDLTLWAHPRPDLIMFFWSATILLEPLMYLTSLFFVGYILNEQRNSYFRFSLYLTIVLTIPIALLLPTQLGIQSFNLTNCFREVTEGSLVLYGYAVQAIILLTIVVVIISHLTKANIHKNSIYTSLSVILFLSIFTGGNVVGTITGNWKIGQFALYGMPIMVFVMSYLISERQLITNKVVATRLFVIILGVVSISLSLVQSLALVRVISVVNFILILLLGHFLVRAVKREVKQREEIEGLAKKLERANVRLKELDKQKSEFVSIASHQLRSPLTAIRGYASMLADGSYGTLSSKMIEPVNRIQDASRLMAESIEDFLNVSRIEGGNMKYELSDFNLRDRTERLVDDLRPEGFKKGLLLLFKQDLTGTGVVHADVGKTEQILHNLINNALKYTPKGTITVFVHDDPKKKLLIVDILDTGIGMSEETIMSLFEKFTRAKNANSVNIKGTGLGLYVAREMARKMGGDITAHSEGEGKGSRFTFTIPMVL